MEIWKTLRVSHIPTPPATTTDKCLTRRYTNIPLGTKDRSGHQSDSAPLAKDDDIVGWPDELLIDFPDFPDCTLDSATDT
jgi:hypothetical protein